MVQAMLPEAVRGGNPKLRGLSRRALLYEGDSMIPREVTSREKPCGSCSNDEHIKIHKNPHDDAE